MHFFIYPILVNGVMRLEKYDFEIESTDPTVTLYALTVFHFLYYLMSEFLGDDQTQHCIK